MNHQLIINQTLGYAKPLGTLSSFLLGSGLYYVIQNEKYWHIPLVLICPTAYTGYHVYKNKESITQYIRKLY